MFRVFWNFVAVFSNHPNILYAFQVTKNAVYSAPVSSKKFTGSQVLNVASAYAPPVDQSYAQGRQLLYTQAYIAPSQPSQYVSQLVYAQPATIYMQAAPVYTDVYARPPGYDQDNSLQGKYAAPIEHTPVVDDLSNQVLGQQSSHTVTRNYVKVRSRYLNIKWNGEKVNYPDESSN